MPALQWTEPGKDALAANIRIVFLDLLRGVAVLGIFWINITAFADQIDAYIYSSTGINMFITWDLTGRFTNNMIDGTMRGLFSLLFGASAIVFLSEARLAANGLEVVDRYYRRTLVLLTFGIIHAYVLLWPHDVLYVYGLLGMFLFPIRNRSPRSLFILGVIILALGDTIAPHMDNTDSDKTEQASLDKTDTEVAAKTLQEPASENIEQMLKDSPVTPEPPSYIQAFKQNIGDVLTTHTYVMYTDYIFDMGGMMVVGIALLKYGVLQGAKSLLFYFLLMLVGYITGFIARDIIVFNTLVFYFPTLEAYEEPLLTYNLGRFLVTMGHVGMVGIIFKIRLLQPLLVPFIALGRMALTNYVSQTLLALITLYFFISDLYNLFPRINVLYVLIGVWITQTLITLAWLHYFRFGPLEWLWRSIIYGQWQKLRKNKNY